MRRTRLSVIGASAFTLIIVIGGAAPSYGASQVNRLGATTQLSITQQQQPICEHDSPNLCWRDVGDGGLATIVENSGYGTDNARLWLFILDTKRCGDNGGRPGYVSNKNACPFTPGSGLNFQFDGDQIVNVANLGSGYCAGSDTVDGNNVYMHVCDIKSSSISTVFIVEDFSTHFRLVSLVHSNACSCADYVNGDATPNDPLTIGSPDTYSRWVIN